MQFLANPIVPRAKKTAWSHVRKIMVKRYFSHDVEEEVCQEWRQLEKDGLWIRSDTRSVGQKLTRLKYFHMRHRHLGGDGAVRMRKQDLGPCWRSHKLLFSLVRCCNLIFTVNNNDVKTNIKYVFLFPAKTMRNKYNFYVKELM